MDYKNVEKNILDILKNDAEMIIEKNVQPLIEFYFNTYIKLNKAGFKLSSSILIKNEPENLITQLEDYSMLNNYNLEEKNYIKALFVLYVNEEELKIY